MAIKYLAANILTGLSSDTKPTNVPADTIFVETNTRKLYSHAGSGTWNILGSAADVAETLSNKTIGNYLDFTSQGGSAPGDPSTSIGRLYIKQLDVNNEGLFLKIKKAGIISEMQLT